MFLRPRTKTDIPPSVLPREQMHKSHVECSDLIHRKFFWLISAMCKHISEGQHEVPQLSGMGNSWQSGSLGAASRCPPSQSALESKLHHRGIRHHFHNYLWLNNKQVLKALVRSDSPRLFLCSITFCS